ncbi:MAG: hypothetical protein J6S67_04690, partial [Methanobrevibacter sp.]|nr:hypothetical protein [Methanobrevibacter sp.]
MFSKKYICLLLIFIVGLMAVSQVSAAEDNINDTVGMDENEEIILEKNTSHDVLAAENGNDLLSANPTFKDLNDVINGNDDSVINLAQDYKFDSNIDTDFKKGIVIDRDLTINGNGHMIDADGRARIFNVTDTHVVLFNNISFVKGSGQGNAGAVIGGTSINCNFTDCAAISGEGGAAIYKGTAVNCTFTRNLVLIGQGGAAMYMGYAINCTFIENNAPFGGAMYGGTAVNCTFKGNKARNGGAIYETSARNCIFISNAASSGSGGAASNSDCYNCYFEHNSANAGGAGYGGNYYVCIFESNQVIDGTSGGALYEPHFAFNCTFRNNAAEEGSGIYGGAAAYCIFSNNSRVGTVYQLNPDIVADDFDSIYGAGDVFDFKVMASNVEIYDLKVTLTLYRLMEDGSEEYVNDFHLLSGQGWIIDLDRGSYKIKLTLDDFEYSAVARVSLNVIKVPTTISLNATHIITNPVDTTYLIATLKDYKNNPLGGFDIFVDYNDKTYTTDANGQATVPIGDLPLGMHTILFKFDGDGDYNGTSAAVTAEVYKLPTEITSPEKSYGFSYNKAENTVNVTLMDNLGRPVSGVKLTVYLNGTTENYTTDENGTIRILVSAFLPGNYSLNVTFEGDDNYIKSNNTYSFEVFKVETALSGNLTRG